MMTPARSIPANPRSLEIEYAIRDVILPAMELERKGYRILKLNIGDPNKYDFDTPKFIRESVKEALDTGYNGYGPSRGYPDLLDAIIDDERSRGVEYKQEDITVTAGVTEAMQMLFYASLSPGDEVLIPGPSYPPYITYVRMMGAVPVPYRTIEEKGWIPDVEDIRKKINEKTKALAVINPNNPTGSLYGREVLKQIGEILKENPQTYLISDEIYNLMTFGEECPSTGEVLKDVPMIVFNGISKIYLAPGWRIGYMGIRDPYDQLADIRDGVDRQARARLCPNSICEYGYYKALTGPRDHINDTMAKLRKRRDLAYRRINEIEGMSTQNPGGAFYMFPRIDCMENGPWKNDKEFVLDLLKEEKVLTVFGSGFGEEYGKDHLRIVILPEEDDLNAAFDGFQNIIKKRIG